MTAASNTQSPDKNVRWGVSGHGVDTLALVFRGPEVGPLLDHLSDMTQAGEMRHGKGGAVLAKKSAGAPATIGWYPAHHMAFVEGRLAPIFEGSREDRRLWPLPDLPYAREAAWDLFTKHLDGPKLGTPDHCAVSRIDLTSEVEFDQGGGLPFLAALAALDVPRYKVDVWRNQGRTETVYLRTPKRGIAHLRAYDKGVESGTEPAGQRIRFERQARFAKVDQMSPETFSARDAGHLHSGGLRPLRDASAGVEVGGSVEIVNRLADLWRMGVISRSKARRLAGYVSLAAQSAPVTESEERAERRQAKELRDLGLAVADWEVPGTIPMGDVLKAVSEAFAPC